MPPVFRLWTALTGLIALSSCEPVHTAPAHTAPVHTAPIHPMASQVQDVLPPAAPPRPPALTAQLTELVAGIDPIATPPRTRHLRPDGRPLYANRLLLEGSPYLRQHAHNPVDWRPWGDEAFADAQRLGRPVLLSVGYATCHWCHVMEEESFEDPEIAAFLNDHFVCVKVDREERPDVDAVYMTAVTALTGRGGWPMTVFLTPDRQPFYGGTYFPAREGDRGSGRAAFLPLIQLIHEKYSTDPAEAQHAAERLSAEIQRRMAPPISTVDHIPDVGTFAKAAAHFGSRSDPTYGGLTGAPKFPSSMPVRLLLRLHQRTGHQEPLDIARLALDQMAAGGLRDHLAGGFHRYSTDAQWRVPHFEKMLYDQGLLALAYLDAWQVSGLGRDAKVARGILDDALANLQSPEGAFYSALDADSASPTGEKVEGWFYTWTPAELTAVLSADDAALATEWFGAVPAGHVDGRSVLHTPQTLTDLSTARRQPPEVLQQRLDTLSATLLQARSLRPPPLRDEKVVTAWNGLLISALAKAGHLLGDPAYTREAARAADFLWTTLRVDGRLHRIWTGTPRQTAMLEDHAFLAAGMLDLFEATGDPLWLTRARTLTQDVDTHFTDPVHGAWFRTPADSEALLVREKPDRDGAVPSGTSAHLMNLLRLHALTTDDTYRAQADAGFVALSPILSRAPAAMSETMVSLDWRHSRVYEVAIVVPEEGDPEPMRRAVAQSGSLHHVLVMVRGDPTALQAEVPWIEGKVARDGQVTAYVCEGGTCQAPTTDPETVLAALSRSPS